MPTLGDMVVPASDGNWAAALKVTSVLWKGRSGTSRCVAWGGVTAAPAGLSRAAAIHVAPKQLLDLRPGRRDLLAVVVQVCAEEPDPAGVVGRLSR
jgi:hypothetical protein